MASIQIRDVPDHIYRSLVDLAHREHRSLAQQVVAVLAAGLNVRLDAQTRRRELLEKRPVISGVNKLPDAATLIRQDRER